MISITEAAANRIKALIEQDPELLGLHLEVVSSGCNGYAYKLEPVRGSADPELVMVEYQGARIWIHPDDQSYLRGTEVDYHKETFGERFVFQNPNESSRCGCGKSFQINE